MPWAQGSDDTLLDRELLVGRDHIDMVGLDFDRPLELHDRHPGASAQQLGKVALLRGIQMGRDHKAEPAIFRKGAEELLQGFEATCRRADAHDRKVSHGR